MENTLAYLLGCFLFHYFDFIYYPPYFTVFLLTNYFNLLTLLFPFIPPVFLQVLKREMSMLSKVIKVLTLNSRGVSFDIHILSNLKLHLILRYINYT